MRRQEQGTKALISLRDAILGGEFQPGERLLELSLVERLRISRTPIRYALDRLADEGFIEKVRGGYSVRAITRQEIRDAIRVRGVVEGIAARLAADRKTPLPEPLAIARQCIVDLDEVLQEGPATKARRERYHDINGRFHDSIIQMAGRFVIQRALNYICAAPFASPNAFVMAKRDAGDVREDMYIAQQQHRILLEAIENHESARAEAMAREHAERSMAAMRSILESRPANAEPMEDFEVLRTSEIETAGA